MEAKETPAAPANNAAQADQNPPTGESATSRAASDSAAGKTPKGRRVAAALITVALLTYGTADAMDVVPGILTTTPTPPKSLPFPKFSSTAAEPTAPQGLVARAGAPTNLQSMAEAFSRDPRVLSAVPGQPREGEEDENAEAGAPQEVDPTMGLAAQQSVPPGTPAAVLVYETSTGAVLADVGSTTPRTPASTLKLLTIGAAEHVLDPARRLATSTTLGEGGVVTLVGGGDVLLGAEKGNPSAVQGRAGLIDLADATADALREARTTLVTLHLDDTALPPEGLAAGLKPEDARWVMRPAALAVEQGTHGGGRHSDPGMQAAEMLAAALTERGIEVTSVERGANPEDATELASVQSAPIAELITFASKESDNTVTETLARLIALERGEPTDRASSTKAVREVLGDLGVDLEGVEMHDASGLSPRNRVTARALADVLQLGVRDANDGRGEIASAATLPGLIPTLPVAALDGTLDDRMHGTAAAGVTRGKTGTLSAVASLAGTLVDADGRLLTYAIITDGLPRGGIHPARAATDQFLAALAACGCS